MLLPHVVWQVAHGWPTAEFIRNATAEKMKSVSPVSFGVAQVMNLHPLTAPVWLAGLGFSLFARAGRFVRPLGLVYVTVFILLVVNQKSRTGYLAPAYPMLFACGAAWLEPLLARSRAACATVFAAIAIGGGVTAPLVLPLLPPPAYARYAAALGVEPSTEENKEVGALPQHFADRFGWPELLDRLEGGLRLLTAEERARAAVFTSNYGEAGAAELLGRGRGMPGVVSGHNNYWLWGPGPPDIAALLVVAGPAAEPRLRQRCGRVDDTGALHCRWCMPYERDTHVYVCRDLRLGLAALWPRLKHYD
jgi:hypothetical protein